MIVEITAKHVSHAQRNNHFRNPIALALQETDPYATVTLDKVHLACAHGPICAYQSCAPTELPHHAKVYLETFNRSGYVSPTTLVL